MAMARYNFVCQDDDGNIIDGASVEVRHESVGSPLAALKSDRDGLVSLGNPYVAADGADAGFHVAGGSYKIRIYTGPSGAPTFERIWRYVPIGLLSESDVVTFSQAGSGAVSRSIQDKARDIVSVKDFGAVGDWNGTTGTDDTAAFNAALAAGHCAFVPAGEYRIAGTIVMGAFDALIGYSKGSTKLFATTANLPLIQIADTAPEVQISDLTLDRSVTATSGGDGIQCIGGVSLCTLKDLWVYRQWRGLVLGATDGSWARHIIVSACQNDGVFMTNAYNYAPTQWQLHDIYSTSSVENGFHIQSTEGPPAAGLILGKWSNLQTFGNSGYGLLVNGSSTAPVFGIRATNCHFGGDGLGTVRLDTYGYGHAFAELVCEYAGTALTGPAGTTPATNSGNGVDITVNNGDCRLSGVDIRGSADAGLNSACASLIVDGGYIKSNGQNGGSQRFGVVYSAGNVSLSNLTITNDVGSPSQLYGLVAGADTLQMLNCNLTGNATGAVFEAVPLVNSHILGCFPTSLSSLHPNAMKGFTVGGFVIGTSTGGDKGAGTFNAANGGYKNNVAYTNP